MNLVVKFFIVASGFLILAACSNKWRVEMEISRQQAVSIVDAFVAAKYPDFDKNKKNIVAKEVDAQWEITYELPSDMIGGAPVVFIDKKTGAVLRSFRTQ